ncbi:MAG: 4Fe-4S binding protein [Thermodesulfovibrionales bacterium]|jgi:polyferredoxin
MRSDRSYIRKVRYAVQGIISLLVLYVGFTFYLFAEDLMQGRVPSLPRPPSVEGFMPIGALMSLKLLVTEGIFDPVHPAALVLFCGAALSSVLLKKSFCGWICPVGTLSEAVWKVGQRIFGKNVTLPRFIDYPLRSLKYILMAFFLFIILVKMSSQEVIGFLSTPYWKVTDIKLLQFFMEMSLMTQIAIGVLIALSLIVKNFWCRYLCPYGGLLGLVSLLSPVKIKRTDLACIHCGLCSRHCPSLLPVDRKRVIRSPECMGCLTCVSHCPAQGALDAMVTGRKRMSPLAFVLMVMSVYFGLILVAKLTGRWHSSVSYEELRSLVPILDGLIHP